LRTVDPDRLLPFPAINRSLLELQVGPLEGADHCHHEPIMGFIGIGTLVRFG
jgi:hypothetical protein